MNDTKDLMCRNISCWLNPKDVNNLRTISIGQWLNGIIHPKDNKLIKAVEEIRNLSIKMENEIDKSVYDILRIEKAKLKLKLPGVSLGALMSTRDKNVPDNEKIINLTGLICFDIDKVQKPAHLRDQLKKVNHVIFASLSVSGNGVWGLIEIAYPDKIKQHFEQLQMDFLAIGIKLDSSKGGNPTDLRFYSYDPDAYLSEKYKVYDRLPEIKQPKSFVKTNNQSKHNPIAIAVSKINQAQDGEKHNELLKAAHLLGGYIASGAISYDESESALLKAIEGKNIISVSGAIRTIAAGLKHGQNQPIHVNSMPSVNIINPIFVKPQFSAILTWFQNPDNLLNININHHDIILPLHEWIKKPLQSAIAGDQTSIDLLMKVYNEIVTPANI